MKLIDFLGVSNEAVEDVDGEKSQAQVTNRDFDYAAIVGREIERSFLVEERNPAGRSK